MKIGILTFHNTLNYGSFLQTLGLYNAIKIIGYDCDIIDYKCDAIEKSEFPDFKLEGLHPKKILKYFLCTKKLKQKYDCFQFDLKHYVTLSNRYFKNTIADVNNEYDYFLVGSDILWDLKLTNNDFAYFLDFVNSSKKKYSFSTSIGGEWDKETVNMVRPLINDFQRISIREKTSAQWMKKEFKDVSIEEVCDPTMLCDQAYWNKLADAGRLKIKGKYILVYFPTDELIKDAKDYSNKKKLKIICIGLNYKYRGMKHVLPPSVADWLQLVRGAEAVFTGSYHGILFSLYFNKKLYIYYRSNKGHNVRVSDIIELFNLEDGCKYSMMNIDKPLDYVYINRKLEELRNDSYSVLKEYWEGDENK